MEVCYVMPICHNWLGSLQFIIDDIGRELKSAKQATMWAVKDDENTKNQTSLYWIMFALLAVWKDFCNLTANDTIGRQ